MRHIWRFAAGSGGRIRTDMPLVMSQPSYQIEITPQSMEPHYRKAGRRATLNIFFFRLGLSATARPDVVGVGAGGPALCFIVPGPADPTAVLPDSHPPASRGFVDVEPVFHFTVPFLPSTLWKSWTESESKIFFGMNCFRIRLIGCPYFPAVPGRKAAEKEAPVRKPFFI